MLDNAEHSLSLLQFVYIILLPTKTPFVEYEAEFNIDPVGIFVPLFHKRNDRLIHNFILIGVTL